MNSQALWYLTRGFGLVSLVLLTLTTVLGLAQVARYVSPGWPRFVISALHKNASLLAVVAIAIHVITAVLDTYAPIAAVDAFVPLASRYRPLWTGLGALALDLMLAVVVTSLLRHRLGHRTWRAIHWAAYGSWPIAALHGLGTGTDTKVGWVLFLYVACAISVVVALWWRLAKGWNPANALIRGAAVAASIVVPLAIVGWTAAGPLRAGWARRSGTPPSLLATSSRTSPPVTSRSVPSLSIPFDTSFQGSQSENGPNAEGLVSVVITGSFTDGASGLLRMVLTGQPADGGGVNLTGSQVSIGTSANPNEFQGQVSRLDGDTVVISLQDNAGTSAQAVMKIEPSSGNTIRGELRMQE
jgi:sulfoxide reductase heme-binding subunit YedZ